MRMLTRVGVVVTLTFALVGPAHAEFTDAEKAAALRLENATNLIASSLYGYNAYTLDHFVTPQTRVKLANATLASLHALDEAQEAVSALNDVIVEQHGTPLYDRLEAAGRRGRVSRALWRVERLKWMVPHARSLFQKAATVKPRDASYQDHVRRTIMTLDWAEAELHAFDTTLGYAEPHLASYPKVIGPHGRFDSVQWNLWRGRVYIIRSMSSTINALRTGEDSMNWTSAGRGLTGLAWATRTTVTASNSLSNIVAPDGPYAGIDPFGRTLAILRQLTSKELELGTLPATFLFSAGYDFRDVYLSQMHLGSAEFRHWVMDAAVMLLDGWSHTDMAAWELMAFPGCPPTCRGGRR